MSHIKYTMSHIVYYKFRVRHDVTYVTYQEVENSFRVYLQLAT